ncbi:unnamed protein product [Larinioides sclopetarius]|uniref:Uncharacterized protein n=1 Tax=Larinioides sclopetarius TaxID=280406 RepID=A0AAV2BXP5_9ARAC
MEVPMSDDSDDDCPKRAADTMNYGMVALFESFILREDYDAAMDFIDDCFGYAPTPFVINEIIFKIMMNCNEKLAYKAAGFLECKMRVMFAHEDQKINFISALKDQSGTNSNIWDAFSRFVWSSLYSLKVTEAYHIQNECIKSPNCDLLVDIYIKAFLKCSVKSDILGSHVEERLSVLLQWINLYYKYNFDDEPVLSYLHQLLDYIVDSEISSDSSLPLSVKIHTVNLSQYMFLILNNCKDAFATVEKQQRFFIYSMSYCLIIKICQYRLLQLIEEKSQPQNPRMLTLKSIVDNFFFHRPEKSSSVRKPISPRRSCWGMQLKKFSKDPIPGDTSLHKHCRLARPADLLCILYAEKSKDINEKNRVGNTPLHEACLSSSYLCCKFLIEETVDRKVDFRATDNEGRTPLFCAVYVDSFDIVKLLLHRGGNDLVKCRDNWGKKPVDYSTSDEMKKMLQEYESKLEETGEEEFLESLVSSELKLPNLKHSKDYYLYLRTLRTFVLNYCEIYDLPKTETDVKTLSHDSKECYHYKADCKTLCMEDASILDTFSEVVMKFISCAKFISEEESVKKELCHWKRFSTVFK